MPVKSASITEIKKELQKLPAPHLLDLCLRVAKYKKDNKELFSYLLFEAEDEQSFVEHVKAEIDEQFAAMNTSNIYLAKKTIRKTLRTTNKYIRYSGIKQTAAELLIYFCRKLHSSRIPLHKHTSLSNLYQQQLKKINKALESMHEDLQYDYRKELEKLA